MNGVPRKPAVLIIGGLGMLDLLFGVRLLLSGVDFAAAVEDVVEFLAVRAFEDAGHAFWSSR